jgi:phosphoribosylformylglycinamidine cyclo-ligase
VTTTYLETGVDLRAASDLAERIRGRIGSGLFGGFVPVWQLKAYRNPVLVSSVDGIGTKTRLAAQLGRIDGLGRDIVHHCVNDIAVHGATPLFFLDYLAFHRLEPAVAGSILDDIEAACSSLGIKLVGGETAEMPGVYREGCFDIAGAIVGAVEQDEIVDGGTIRVGDVLIGLASNGVHTNGFSLIQSLFSIDEYDTFEPALGASLGESLLPPHRCYFHDIQSLLAHGHVHGLAHITGGGIAGNLSRVIPAGLQAVVELPPAPPLFQLIQEHGVSTGEMRGVFNLGIGIIAVCDARILAHLPAGWVTIGSIRENHEYAERVVFTS